MQLIEIGEFLWLIDVSRPYVHTCVVADSMGGHVALGYTQNQQSAVPYFCSADSYVWENGWCDIGRYDIGDTLW